MSDTNLEPYKTWIIANVVDAQGRGAYGNCDVHAKAMAEAFPELELRKGFFYCSSWGRRTHWWCRLPLGNGESQIVDPTAEQHPSGVVFPKTDACYEDLTDMSEEELAEVVPTGVCPNCGDPVYKGRTLCGTDCERAYCAYLGVPYSEG